MDCSINLVGEICLVCVSMRKPPKLFPEEIHIYNLIFVSPFQLGLRPSKFSLEFYHPQLFCFSAVG